MNVFSPLRKKIQKKACAKKLDPYNAPPLTRQTGNGMAVQETQETASPEKNF